MHSQVTVDDLSSAALQFVQDLGSRLTGRHAAEILWHRRFTDAEKQKLGGDLYEAYGRWGTFGMWREVRRGKPERERNLNGT